VEELEEYHWDWLDNNSGRMSSRRDDYNAILEG
jgi:hypothetical protein